jgi:hypothetical protein
MIIVTKKAGTVTVLGLEHDLVNEVADDARQEHDEGVHHALYQRQRHHVAIRGVRHFVADDRFGFGTGHLLQQAARHRDERTVLAHARGERVHVGRIVDADLGHLDAGLGRVFSHRLVQPELGRVGRRFDDPHAHRALGGPLGDRQRNERAAEAHHGGEYQQRAQVEAVLVQIRLHAEQTHGEGQHQHDGQIGAQKKQDAFHDSTLLNRPQREIAGTDSYTTQMRGTLQPEGLQSHAFDTDMHVKAQPNVEQDELILTLLP